MKSTYSVSPLPDNFCVTTLRKLRDTLRTLHRDNTLEADILHLKDVLGKGYEWLTEGVQTPHGGHGPAVFSAEALKSSLVRLRDEVVPTLLGPIPNLNQVCSPRCDYERALRTVLAAMLQGILLQEAVQGNLLSQQDVNRKILNWSAAHTRLYLGLCGNFKSIISAGGEDYLMAADEYLADAFIESPERALEIGYALQEDELEGYEAFLGKVFGLNVGIGRVILNTAMIVYTGLDEVRSDLDVMTDHIIRGTSYGKWLVAEPFNIKDIRCAVRTVAVGE